MSKETKLSKDVRKKTLKLEKARIEQERAVFEYASYVAKCPYFVDKSVFDTSAINYLKLGQTGDSMFTKKAEVPLPDYIKEAFNEVDKA